MEDRHNKRKRRAPYLLSNVQLRCVVRNGKTSEISSVYAENMNSTDQELPALIRIRRGNLAIVMKGLLI